jgi:hypothetical protein
MLKTAKVGVAGVDRSLQLPLLSMNLLNQTEPETFSTFAVLSFL